MDATEKLKKFGAGAIIFLLAIMMGVMFLPGSIEDYTGTLQSKSNVGKYDGRAITRRDYQYAASDCARRVPNMGSNQRFRDMMIRSCAQRGIREMFVLPDIGKAMGHNVSANTVRARLYEAAKQQHAAQGSTTDPDDRLSVDEIYDRLMRNIPMAHQLRRERALGAARALSSGFPFPQAQLESAHQAGSIVLDVSFVRYNDAMLLARLEKTVKVTEDQVRKAHKEEQKKFAPKNRKPFKAEKTGVRNRLRSRLKQAELAKVKAEISKGKFSLARVRSLTGAPIKRVPAVPLSKLAQAPLAGGGKVDLNIPDFLASFGAQGNDLVQVGPVIKNRQIYFLEARVRRAQSKPLDSKLAQKQVASRGRDLARRVVRNMIDQQASRGDFQLKPVRLR